MKAVLFALALSVVAAPAFADPFGRGGFGRGDHGRWDDDHGHGGWGARCTVVYQKCAIPINIKGFSFCPKWNSKSESIDARDARWTCERLERQYGELRQCEISCNDGRGGRDDGRGGGGRGPGRRF